MAKVENGIKFADGVDTSKIDWKGEPDPELMADLEKIGKVRITTMIDEDLLMALKKKAKADKRYGGKYQTLLNDLLREALGESLAVSTAKFEEATAQLNRTRKALEKAMARFEATTEKNNAGRPRKKNVG